MLALGVSLARRGFMPILSMVICLLTVVVCSVVAIVLGGRGPQAPVHDVPILASSALAWGGGFLLAFAVAAHALRRDRESGIRDLLLVRTTSLRGYLVGRVGGLAALLALVVGGGTLLCGLVAMLSASRISAVPKTLQATAAAVAFSLAFAAVVAPVAFAALGARSRIGGYLFLLGVVVLPELVVGLVGSSLPEGVADLFSIPSALSALRTALAPGGDGPLRALHAAIALLVFAGLATALVRAEAAALERGDDA